jgi:hypothetical protein
MSYDLALGPSNDLMFAANRDLLGVSGTAIYDQRIRTRLKIRRGTWVFDSEKKLGSRIDLVLGRSSDRAASEITAFVHEALADMSDIIVTGVQTVIPDQDTRASMLSVNVSYTILPDPGEAPFMVSDDQDIDNIVNVQL